MPYVDSDQINFKESKDLDTLLRNLEVDLKKLATNKRTEGEKVIFELPQIPQGTYSQTPIEVSIDRKRLHSQLKFGMYVGLSVSIGEDSHISISDINVAIYFLKDYYFLDSLKNYE